MEENNYRPYIWMFEGDMDAHVQDYLRLERMDARITRARNIQASDELMHAQSFAMSQFQTANQLLQAQAFVLNGADISQRTLSGLIYEQVSKMRF